MRARLARYEGGKLSITFPLPTPGSTIGRDFGNQIRLPDTEVSRQHAVIHAKDNMWVIKDLGSTNGVIVNGKKVEHALLKNGDSIAIGPFQFVFQTVDDGKEFAEQLGHEMLPEAKHPTVETKLPPAPKTVPYKPG